MERKICSTCKLPSQARQDLILYSFECSCMVPKRTIDECKKRVKKGELPVISVKVTDVKDPIYDVVQKPPTRKNSLPEDPKSPVKRTAPNIPATVPNNPGTSQMQQGGTTPHPVAPPSQDGAHAIFSEQTSF